MANISSLPQELQDHIFAFATQALEARFADTQSIVLRRGVVRINGTPDHTAYALEVRLYKRHVNEYAINRPLLQRARGIWREAVDHELEIAIRDGGNGAAVMNGASWLDNTAFRQRCHSLTLVLSFNKANKTTIDYCAKYLRNLLFDLPNLSRVSVAIQRCTVEVDSDHGLNSTPQWCGAASKCPLCVQVDRLLQDLGATRGPDYFAALNNHGRFAV